MVSVAVLTAALLVGDSDVSWLDCVPLVSTAPCGAPNGVRAQVARVLPSDLRTCDWSDLRTRSAANRVPAWANCHRSEQQELQG